MRNENDRQPGPGDIIETEDGFRFAVLEDGSITDGDMAWENFEQFRSTMADDPQGPIGWGIKYRQNITRRDSRCNGGVTERENARG
jgi:hypothetical protein